MLASYRLIQYLPDRMFPAPVTVGIAAWTAGETRLRIIGFDVATNQPEIDVFRRAFDLPHDAEPMLLEWIRWFQDVVGQRGRFDEVGVHLLERLESKDFPFVASQAGESDIEARELDAFVDDLFRRAVLALPQIRHARLEHAALNCLATAGLTKAAGSLDLQLQKLQLAGAGGTALPGEINEGKVNVAIGNAAASSGSGSPTGPASGSTAAGNGGSSQSLLLGGAILVLAIVAYFLLRRRQA